jgi:hypothetical protein
VICLDLKSGSIVWEHVAHKGVPAKPYHIKNTLASETATTDGEAGLPSPPEPEGEAAAGPSDD